MANLFLLAAAILCVCGMAWLALAMDTHWKQLRNTSPSKLSIKILRSLGSLSLVASLLFCLATDHASMASLVWMMLLAASALSVAFILSWRPGLLSPLIAWAR